MTTNKKLNDSTFDDIYKKYLNYIKNSNTEYNMTTKTKLNESRNDSKNDSRFDNINKPSMYKYVKHMINNNQLNQYYLIILLLNGFIIGRNINLENYKCPNTKLQKDIMNFVVISNKLQQYSNKQDIDKTIIQFEKLLQIVNSHARKTDTRSIDNNNKDVIEQEIQKRINSITIYCGACIINTINKELTTSTSINNMNIEERMQLYDKLIINLRSYYKTNLELITQYQKLRNKLENIYACFDNTLIDNMFDEYEKWTHKE